MPRADKDSSYPTATKEAAQADAAKARGRPGANQEAWLRKLKASEPRRNRTGRRREGLRPSGRQPGSMAAKAESLRATQGSQPNNHILETTQPHNSDKGCEGNTSKPRPPRKTAKASFRASRWPHNTHHSCNPSPRLPDFHDDWNQPRLHPAGPFARSRSRGPSQSRRN